MASHKLEVSHDYRWYDKELQQAFYDLLSLSTTGQLHGVCKSGEATAQSSSLLLNLSNYKSNEWQVSPVAEVVLMEKSRIWKTESRVSHLIRNGPVWMQVSALAQCQDTWFNQWTNRGLQSGPWRAEMGGFSAGLKQTPAPTLTPFGWDWTPLVWMDSDSDVDISCISGHDVSLNTDILIWGKRGHHMIGGFNREVCHFKMRSRRRWRGGNLYQGQPASPLAHDDRKLVAPLLFLQSNCNKYFPLVQSNYWKSLCNYHQHTVLYMLENCIQFISSVGGKNVFLKMSNLELPESRTKQAVKVATKVSRLFWVYWFGCWFPATCFPFWGMESILALPFHSRMESTHSPCLKLLTVHLPFLCDSLLCTIMTSL